MTEGSTCSEKAPVENINSTTSPERKVNQEIKNEMNIRKQDQKEHDSLEEDCTQCISSNVTEEGRDLSGPSAGDGTLHKIFQIVANIFNDVKEIKNEVQSLKSTVLKHDERVDNIEQKVDEHGKKLFEAVKSYSIEHEKQCSVMLEKTKNYIADDITERQKKAEETMTKEHNEMRECFSSMKTACSEQFASQLNENNIMLSKFIQKMEKMSQKNLQAVAHMSKSFLESGKTQEEGHVQMIENSDNHQSETGIHQMEDDTMDQDPSQLDSQNSQHDQASGAESAQVLNLGEDDQPVQSPSLCSEHRVKTCQPADSDNVQFSIPKHYGGMIILTVDNQQDAFTTVAEDGNLQSAAQDADDSQLDVIHSRGHGESTAESTEEITQPANTNVILVPPNGQLTFADGRKEARESYEELKLTAHQKLRCSVRIILDTNVNLAEKLLRFLQSSAEKKNKEWESLLDILRSSNVDITYGCVVLHPFPRNVEDARTLFESAKLGETATQLRRLLLSDDFLSTHKVEDARMDVITIQQDFLDVFAELSVTRERDIAESTNHLSGRRQTEHPRRQITAEGNTNLTDHLLVKHREHPRRPNTVRLVIDSPHDEAIRALRERFSSLLSQKNVSDDQVETEGASAAVDELGVRITDVRDGCILLDLEITNQEEAEELLRKLKSGKIDDIIKKIAKPVVENTDSLEISFFQDDFEDVVNDLGAASKQRKDPPSVTSATAAKKDKGYICGLAPPSAEVFVGRENILDKIYRSYKGCKQDILEEVSKDNLVHVLTGDPGIGKTQIAVNYAYKYHRDYPKGIFWLNAISMAGLDHGFSFMFETLNLRADVDGDKDCLQAKEIKSQALQWLQLNPGWLLVLDDANDLELMKHYFPAFPCKGHIIITSRQTSFKNVLSGITEEILISPLTTAAATKLLLCCQGTQPSEVYVTIRKMEESDSKEHQALCEVVKVLKGFPQALELAGSYIHHTKSTFANYKDNILSSQSHQICHQTTDEQTCKDKDMCHSLNSFARDSTVCREKSKKYGQPCDEDSSKMSLVRHRKGKVGKMVFAKNLQPSAWTMLRQQIKARCHGPDALKLLDISAFFHSTISKSLLSKEIPIKRSQSIDDHHIPREKEKQTPQSEPDGRFLELLSILQQHNLVLMSSGEPVFSIQTLTQNFVKERLLRKSEKYIETVNDAVELLKREFPKKSEMCKLEIPLPPEKEEIILHAQALQGTFTEYFIEKNKATLLDPVPLFNRIGFYLRAIKRRPHAAESLYKTSFTVAEILLSSESTDVNLRKRAGAHYNLGSVYFDQAKIEQALHFQEIAKELTLKADDEEEKRRKRAKIYSSVQLEDTKPKALRGEDGNQLLRAKKDSKDSRDKVFQHHNSAYSWSCSGKEPLEPTPYCLSVCGSAAQSMIITQENEDFRQLQGNKSETKDDSHSVSEHMACGQDENQHQLHLDLSSRRPFGGASDEYRSEHSDKSTQTYIFCTDVRYSCQNTVKPSHMYHSTNKLGPEYLRICEAQPSSEHSHSLPIMYDDSRPVKGDRTFDSPFDTYTSMLTHCRDYPDVHKSIVPTGNINDQIQDMYSSVPQRTSNQMVLSN